MNPIACAFPGCSSLAARVTEALGAETAALEWHRFPDGESLVTLRGDCANRDVVLIATLRDPDRLALPLLFASKTARELGARSVGLVAPYFAYLRQDERFRAGQSASSIHFAAFISSAFDWLVTVDPHLHRYRTLQDLFAIPAEAVSAVPAIAAWLRAHVAKPVLVGPDAESAQWLEPLAALAGVPRILLAKRRTGDRDVEVSEPAAERCADRSPVIVDDILASGETMLQTVVRLRDAGARPPCCIAVHGLFAGDAALWLRTAGAAAVVTTNTVEHASNAIDVAAPIAAAVRRRLGNA